MITASQAALLAGVLLLSTLLSLSLRAAENCKALDSIYADGSLKTGSMYANLSIEQLLDKYLTMLPATLRPIKDYYYVPLCFDPDVVNFLAPNLTDSMPNKPAYGHGEVKRTIGKFLIYYYYDSAILGMAYYGGHQDYEYKMLARGYPGPGLAIFKRG